MMMQWLVNEVRTNKDDLLGIIGKLTERVEWDSQRILRLEGELKALKARMGKVKD